MITYLKAENFQKHERLEIEFDKDGLTLICGENWAGKTTILRAILYGLFGPSGIPGGAKAAQRRGCPTKPVVELGFKLDTDYHVRRTASVTRLFKQGPGMIANGTRPVNEAIRELLGMDGQTFGLLKYAPQEQAGSILTLGSERLTKLIDQITGVTLVEQVIEKASHEGAVARSMQEQLEIADPEPLRVQVTSLVSDLKARHTAMEGLNLHITGLTKKKNEREKVVEALQKRWNAKQKDVARAASLRGSLETLEDQLARQPMWEAEPDLDKLRKEVVELQKMYDEDVSRGTRQGEIDDKVSWLRQHIQEREDWLRDHKEAILEGAPNDEQMAKYRRLEQEAYERARTAYDDAQKINKLVQESVCPTCERPMEGVDLKKLNDRLARAVAHNAKCSKAYEERSKKVKESDRERALWKEYQVKRDEAIQLSGEVDKLLDESTRLSAASEPSFSQLEDSLHDAREALKKAEVVFETNRRHRVHFEELKKDLEEKKIQLVLLQENMDNVTQDEVRTEENKLNEESQKVQKFRLQYEKDMGEYKRRYAEYEAAHSRYQAAAEAQKKLTELQGRAQLCGKLAKYLRTNRDRFAKQVWEALLVSASSFAQLATSGQIQSVSRTDDGAFEYVEDGHRMAVEAASGVQRAILGVGVRLAIAEALRSPVDFLLLDEVTAGATDEVSLAMSRTLGHAQQQVLMVTHRESDAAVAQHMIAI